MKSIFITGVDTDIGKTFVSLGLCLSMSHKNLKTGYFKPFQSGALKMGNKLIAPDVYEINQYSNEIKTFYSYLFEGEVSPHLASLLNNTEIDINKIKDDFINFSKNCDFTVIEGAGGLYCPACKGKLFSDIIKILNQDIIIVTTPDLGRLNHTLMTIECAKINNINIRGIIINKVPKIKSLSQENFIKELKLFYDGEILSQIPLMNNPSRLDIIEIFSSINL